MSTSVHRISHECEDSLYRSRLRRRERDCHPLVDDIAALGAGLLIAAFVVLFLLALKSVI